MRTITLSAPGKNALSTELMTWIVGFFGSPLGCGYS